MITAVKTERCICYITKTTGSISELRKGYYHKMKKNLTKLLALMMALALVFSLAACGDKTEEQSTNPSDNQVAESVNGDETVAPADSTDPSVTEDPGASENPSASEEDTQKPDDNKPSDTQKPDDNKTGTSTGTDMTKADAATLVKYFNNATQKVSKGTKTIKTVVNEVDAGSIGKFASMLGLDINGLVGGFLGAGTQTHNNSTIQKSTLTSGDINSATCKKSGNNYVVTINVKKCVNPETTANNALTKFTKDFKGPNDVVKALKNEGASASVSATYSPITITATIDATSGKLVKAVYALHYTAQLDNIQYKIIKGLAGSGNADTTITWSNLK